MNNSLGKPHAQKARTTISLEPWLLQYAAEVGRGNISLGIRHALLQYREKLDKELCIKELSAYSESNSGGD